MRTAPDIDTSAIKEGLGVHYGLAATDIEYLPIGYDLTAWAFKVELSDGTSRFLKLRSGEVNRAGLLVPSALLEAGISQVLAPIRTLSGELTAPLQAYTLVLYPFLGGDNAMVRGMNQGQWQEFGRALRAVHDWPLSSELTGLIPTDNFQLSSGQLVRKIQDLIRKGDYRGDTAAQFAQSWIRHSLEIEHTVSKALSLGGQLRGQDFTRSLCHSDIHAANVFVGDDGNVTLVDWDTPLMATRERDLIFVIGSDIARRVEPHEEAWFFDGYGHVEVDWRAFAYYRLERTIEDLAEWGRCVFLTDMSEEAKSAEADFASHVLEAGVGLAPWLEDLLCRDTA